MTTTYTYVYETEAQASRGAVWALYEDVSSWPSWDSTVERVTREGNLAAGVTGTMKLVGQDEPLAYRLTGVEPGTAFVDETPVGPVTVRFSHRFTDADGGAVRAVLRVELDGPPEETAVIGPAVTADIPTTFGALVALASARS